MSTNTCKHCGEHYKAHASSASRAAYYCSRMCQEDSGRRERYRSGNTVQNTRDVGRGRCSRCGWRDCNGNC